MQNQSLDANEIALLTAAMNDKYASQRRNRELSVAVTAKGSEVRVTVTLANEDASYYYPVEGRLGLGEFRGNSREASLFLLDAIDRYFDEYFAEREELFLPIDWAEFSHDGTTFYLKGQIQNLKLEKMADAILERGLDT